MTLGQKRRKFSNMISVLILIAPHIIPGAELVYDAVKRRTSKKSFHWDALAADLPLYINGRYQRSTKAYYPLGSVWKLMGGSWGGDWGDGNHFSLGE